MYRRFASMGSGMFLSWIIPIILIAIIAIAVFMIVNNNMANSKSRNDSAMDILNERFARGEIDEEEYRNKKKNLSE